MANKKKNDTDVQYVFLNTKCGCGSNSACIGKKGLLVCVMCGTLIKHNDYYKK